MASPRLGGAPVGSVGVAPGAVTDSTGLPARGRATWRALSRPQRRLLTFTALVAPAILLRLATAAYPIGQTLYLSVSDVDLANNTSAFVGAHNYQTALQDPGARTAVVFTIVFVLTSTLLELALGLGVALLLHQRFKARAVARVLNLIPWAIPTIVAAFAFRWMLDDQYGLLPDLVRRLVHQRSAPLISAAGAIQALILVNVWKNAPFMAVIFLAGLQGVPDDLYDAARVDGANALRRFLSITLPLLLPLLITMSMFFVVWQLASFDLVYGLTNGGPGVATMLLALRIFQDGLLYFKFGVASALSAVMLVMVGLVGLLGLLLFRRQEVVL